MSASLSIKSTISLVRLQSNSFIVHLTCSSISNRSSILTLFCDNPFYSSYSSRARVVNGVSTITAWPSFLTHLLGADIVSKKDFTRSSLFLIEAWFFSLSIVCNNLTSFLSNALSATLRSSSSRPSLFLIFWVSLCLQISSSCYNTLKSSAVRGCILLSISFLCFSSWSLSRFSFLSSLLLSWSNFLTLRLLTNLRANHPLTQHWINNAFSSLLRTHCSLVN